MKIFEFAKIVSGRYFTFGNRSDDEANWLFAFRHQIRCFRSSFSTERQANLFAAHGQMIRDWVLYDFQQFQARVRSLDRELVQQLYNEASKTRKCPGDPRLRVDLNEDVIGGTNVNLNKRQLVT